MSQQKILLLCSSRFALPSMRDLLYYQHLSAIVIPAYCTDMVDEVKQLLAVTNIPVILVNKENNEAELKKTIKKYDISMVFMMTYSYKITRAVYELPEKGFYNFHSGPLPEYRGADPIFQQIKNREPLVGVTVHKLDDRFDTGPIVIKEMIKLEPADTYGILDTKLAELSAKLCGIIIKMAGFDIAIPSKAQDVTKARYFKRQGTYDIIINWNTMSAEEIIALINACNPWNKGAITSINNKIIRLLDAEKIAAQNHTGILPGTVLSTTENSITVAVIHDAELRIDYVYMDEGFLKAGKLSYIGVVPGTRFSTL